MFQSLRGLHRHTRILHQKRQAPSRQYGRPLSIILNKENHRGDSDSSTYVNAPPGPTVADGYDRPSDVSSLLSETIRFAAPDKEEHHQQNSDLGSCETLVNQSAPSSKTSRTSLRDFDCPSPALHEDRRSAFQCQHDRSKSRDLSSENLDELQLSIQVLTTRVIANLARIRFKESTTGYSSSYENYSSTLQNSNEESSGTNTRNSQIKQQNSNNKRPSKNGDENNNDDDDDNDDHDEKRRRNGSNLTDLVEPEKEKRYACPYAKRDPQAYEACNSKVMHSVPAVKQHLVRKHEMGPFFCGNCYKHFEYLDKLTSHENEKVCVAQQETEHHRTCLRVKKRSERNKDQKQAWFSLYKILFPSEDVPPNPYLNMASTEIDHLSNLIKFVLKHCDPELKSKLEKSDDADIPASTRRMALERFECVSYVHTGKNIHEPSSSNVVYSTATTEPSRTNTISFNTPSSHMRPRPQLFPQDQHTMSGGTKMPSSGPPQRLRREVRNVMRDSTTNQQVVPSHPPETSSVQSHSSSSVDFERIPLYYKNSHFFDITCQDVQLQDIDQTWGATKDFSHQLSDATNGSQVLEECRTGVGDTYGLVNALNSCRSRPNYLSTPNPPTSDPVYLRPRPATLAFPAQPASTRYSDWSQDTVQVPYSGFEHGPRSSRVCPPSSYPKRITHPYAAAWPSSSGQNAASRSDGYQQL